MQLIRGDGKKAGGWDSESIIVLVLVQSGPCSACVSRAWQNNTHIQKHRMVSCLPPRYAAYMLHRLPLSCPGILGQGHSPVNSALTEKDPVGGKGIEAYVYVARPAREGILTVCTRNAVLVDAACSIGCVRGPPCTRNIVVRETKKWRR